MSNVEIRRFLMQGTFTGKLATVKKEGFSHVVPIWFVVDNGNSKSRVGDIIFTTSIASVKARNLHRDKRVSICIDDQTPPFTFVTIFGHCNNISLQAKGGFKMGHKNSRTLYGKEQCRSIW
jgi:nitroimidazol reductase NimA-like FMN-containing flavoprotein (pyridoxamine 5'-phosphate oxidase superfamily)